MYSDYISLNNIHNDENFMSNTDHTTAVLQRDLRMILWRKVNVSFYDKCPPLTEPYHHAQHTDYSQHHPSIVSQRVIGACSNLISLFDGRESHSRVRAAGSRALLPTDSVGRRITVRRYSSESCIVGAMPGAMGGTGTRSAEAVSSPSMRSTWFGRSPGIQPVLRPPR